MNEEKVYIRASTLTRALDPLSQHNDLCILPLGYDHENDILYMEVKPRSGPEWAETAYEFAKQEGMKYDRDTRFYGIDGQPRVSYSGLVWVRYIGPFVDASKVAFHVWSQQASHEEAEGQLIRLYGIFKERDGLEPVEVFRKYF